MSTVTGITLQTMSHITALRGNEKLFITNSFIANVVFAICGIVVMQFNNVLSFPFEINIECTTESG